MQTMRQLGLDHTRARERYADQRASIMKAVIASNRLTRLHGLRVDVVMQLDGRWLQRVIISDEWTPVDARIVRDALR